MSLYNPQRPLIHFAPGRNWMNDPNGCVYFNGFYHLYFQYHPHGTEWGPMHWGHAVSTDLLHWEEKGIALYPDDETGMAFSGSAIVDTENLSGFFPDGPGLVAFYTGHLPGQTEEESIQHQCMAHSPDGGDTWVPFDGNPVVPNPGLRDFRDPKVFYHKGSEAWVMVVVAGKEVVFYRSKDFRNWEAAGRFGEGQGLADGIWECPDVFALPDPRKSGEEIWVLAVSILGHSRPAHSPVQYFIGDFDGYQFRNAASPETVLLADYGHDFYATQSWAGLEGQTRSVWIAWANHWAYANEVPAGDWRGVMSLPREISLVERHGSLVLRQVPVREFGSGFADAPIPDESPVDGVHDIYIRTPDAGGGDFSLIFTFAGDGVLKILWDATEGKLAVDRSGVSRGGFHSEFNPCPSHNLSVPESEPLDLRIVLDRSLVEIFALDGTVTFTSQIFPGASLEKICLIKGDGAVFDNLHHRIPGFETEV